MLENSPASGKLIDGDIIRAFDAPLHETVSVTSIATIEDPDYLESYAEFNNFVSLQQKLWQVISLPSFTVILDDDRIIEITSSKKPGIAVLSSTLWWLLLFGAASFMLGVSAWSLRRHELVTQLLAVSGFGFMLGSYGCGLYVTRELAMQGTYMFGLVSLSHLGFVIFTNAAILTFWYFPRKLGSAPVVWLFAIWGLAVWLNETMQWLTWPGHPYYAHYLVAYFLIILFTVLQWRKLRSAPLERAMLRWMLGTMVVTLGFIVILFCIPIMVTGKPLTSTAVALSSVLMFYLGLVIGNIRYRQFDLQHWWFRAWQWFLIIFVMFITDTLFVYFLQLTHTTSFSLSIGIGSIYLLTRQWFWKRYSGQSRRGMDRALPHLVDALMLQQHRSQPEKQWQQLVEHVFNPLTIKFTSVTCSTISVVQGGLALQLPSLDGINAMEVFCCDRGKRLYDASDVNLATRLLELMRHSRDVLAARKQGVQDERHRIQRDLHDDVAARLLSLLHQTQEPKLNNVARNALRGLRDVINLLGAEEVLLEDAITDIEAEVREQLGGLGIKLDWRSSDHWPAVMLSSQQHINLRRIVREAIANALKHAHPENIIVEIAIHHEELDLRIGNNGFVSDPSSWIPGRGLNNIKFRVAEMGGSHKWVIELDGENRQYCHLALRMPLKLHEDPETDSADRRF